MTGLVIKSPWIELILTEQKTWEIRGSRTQMRERIALIKSKSGTIVGGCDVVDCIGPLTLEQLRASEERHRIPLHLLDTLPYPKTFAWVIRDAKPLTTPIVYRHPYGAVIWVNLNEQNVAEFERLAREVKTSSSDPTEKASIPAAERASSRRADAEPESMRIVVRDPTYANSDSSSGEDDGLCRSFSIELSDGSLVVPCRIRDRQTGVAAFKVSRSSNRSDDATLVTDEAKLRQYVDGGYRVRCKSRDGERIGLFSGRNPNRIKDA